MLDGSGPFARMLGGLLTANLQADLDKGALAHRTRGTVGFVVTDTDEDVLLRFTAFAIEIMDAPTDLADLTLVGTSDTLMGLTTVPLRFGMPDPLSAAGRGLAGRWIGGGIEVHGLPRHALLLRSVLQIVNVLA